MTVEGDSYVTRVTAHGVVFSEGVCGYGGQF
jgi:hypothetical protein